MILLRVVDCGILKLISHPMHIEIRSYILIDILMNTLIKMNLQIFNLYILIMMKGDLKLKGLLQSPPYSILDEPKQKTRKASCNFFSKFYFATAFINFRFEFQRLHTNFNAVANLKPYFLVAKVWSLMNNFLLVEEITQIHKYQKI